MLRRQIRQRKEYLYKKSVHSDRVKEHSLKQDLYEVLKSNSTIPKHLRNVADKIGRKLVYDENLPGPLTNIDDEYALIGISDPSVLITTSRDPSQRLLQFAKELRLLIPNSKRINRGNHVLDNIVQACHVNNITDLIILHEHRGIPDGMIISHFPHGPTAYFSISNVVLRHDIKNQLKTRHISEAYPHLIFSNMNNTLLGKRIINILKGLFPIPKADSSRVISFVNGCSLNDAAISSDRDGLIQIRHHTYTKNKIKSNEINLEEHGPRFEIRPYQIKLGLLNVDHADIEWVLRPYMNTSRKRPNLL